MPFPLANLGSTYQRRPSGGLWPNQQCAERSVVELSVVIPCYNEEQGLREAVARAISACEQTQLRFELILVNDGSLDDTQAITRELAARDPRIVGVCLSRNFGQEMAITAGLEFASGAVVAILDADMQDPPELLPLMIERLSRDVDVVYGQRSTRAGESWFKKFTAASFYQVMRATCTPDIPADTGYFRVMRRRVVDAFLAMPEQDRFLRGMLSWVGFRQIPFKFDRLKRNVGQSSWPLRNMLSLAERAVVGYSHAYVYAPLALAMVALLTGLCSLVVLSATDAPIEGHQQTMIITILGTVFTFLQLIGIYFACRLASSVLKNCHGRPVYIVTEIILHSATEHASGDLFALEHSFAMREETSSGSQV